MSAHPAERERDALRQEVLNLQLQLQSAKDVLRSYEDHLREAAEKEQELREAAASRGTVERKEQGAVDRRVKDLEKKVGTLHASKDSLQKELETVKVELGTAREVMRAYEEQLSEHREQHGLREELARALKDAEGLSLQLELSRKSCKKLKADRRASERKLDELRNENSTLREQISGMDAQFRDAEQSSNQLATLYEATKLDCKNVKMLLLKQYAQLRSWERRQMAIEDGLSQQIEIETLQAELGAIKRAEADERSAEALRMAEVRIHDAEERARVAEHNLERMKQQMGGMQDDLPLVDKGPKIVDYGTSASDPLLKFEAPIVGASGSLTSSRRNSALSERDLEDETGGCDGCFCSIM
eukprot:g557.t1